MMGEFKLNKNLIIYDPLGSGKRALLKSILKHLDSNKQYCLIDSDNEYRLCVGEEKYMDENLNSFRVVPNEGFNLSEILKNLNSSIELIIIDSGDFLSGNKEYLNYVNDWSRKSPLNKLILTFYEKPDIDIPYSNIVDLTISIKQIVNG